MFSEFNVGDIVQLKSGGPKMTIMEVVCDFPAKYKCHWYSPGLIGLEDGYKHEIFLQNELKLMKRDE